MPTHLHETGKLIQQRIERDGQHLKGRLAVTHGGRELTGAQILCRAQANLRNLRWELLRDRTSYWRSGAPGFTAAARLGCVDYWPTDAIGSAPDRPRILRAARHLR